MTIYRNQREWLDEVAALPKSELPYNASTVEFAVEVALAYREEAEVWKALFDDLSTTLANENATPDTPAQVTSSDSRDDSDG